MIRASRLIVATLLALAASPSPLAAWKREKDLPYAAVTQCVDENLCLLVGCRSGDPILGLWLFEHGKRVGEPVEIRIDGQAFSKPLPTLDADGLYAWPLDPDIGMALRVGRSAAIVVEPPGGVEDRLSLRGSAKAINNVLKGCVRPSQPYSNVSHLGGLSDNEGCASATTEGVVVDRRFVRSGAELEGFDFQDKYGTGFINISLPDDMPNKLAVHAQLIEMIQPGASLRILSQGCGAAGRIVVLSAVTKLGQTLQVDEARSQPEASDSARQPNVRDATLESAESNTETPQSQNSAPPQTAETAAATAQPSTSEETFIAEGESAKTVPADGVPIASPTVPTQPKEADTTPITAAPAGKLTREHALMFAELAAGRSQDLLDRGERRQAIIAALKGLPKNIEANSLAEFSAPMEALKRAYRSSRVRIDIDVAQPYPMVKSSDFRRVATGITDGTKRDLVLWDTSTGHQLATLTSWPLSSGDMTLWPQFSGDGRFIAANTGPRTAAVWSAEDARRIVELEACEKGSDFAMFGMPAKLSFDGSKLYFGGCVFGLPDGGVLHRIGLAEVVSAAASHGIDTSWFRMNEGPSLQGDFAIDGNVLLLTASAGVERRSILGLLDTDSGSFSFVPVPAEFGQVGQFYPQTATSLKTMRVLLDYSQNNMQGLALLDIAVGRVVWNYIGAEWNLAGLNPDGTVLIRVAPNNWEFVDALNGDTIPAPNGLETADFQTFGDVYNRTGKQIMANYPSALEDVWKDVPDGMALISIALGMLTESEREAVNEQRIDF